MCSFHFCPGRGSVRPTFPRARCYLPKGEWVLFTRSEVLSSQSAVQRNALPSQAMGCQELVGDGHSVTPFATTLSTPDHTPGHLSVIISSGGEKAVIAGDLFHSSVQVTEADWCSGADMDKDTARRSRHAALDHLESEGFPLAAGHLPVGTSIGKIACVRGRRYWQSLS